MHKDPPHPHDLHRLADDGCPHADVDDFPFAPPEPVQPEENTSDASAWDFEWPPVEYGDPVG